METTAVHDTGKPHWQGVNVGFIPLFNAPTFLLQQPTTLKERVKSSLKENDSWQPEHLWNFNLQEEQTLLLKLTLCFLQEFNDAAQSIDGIVQ